MAAAHQRLATAQVSTKTQTDRKTSKLHGVDSSEDSKKTLTIYCWNTEFKSRLDKYYPQGTSNELTYNELADGSKEIATINGVKLNWVQVENEGNAYQTKLDEALKGQQEQRREGRYVPYGS